MIKFRCKAYSRRLPRFIYGSKKAMQAIDNAGLKAGRKIKGYITHKPPTVKDNILLNKSKTQMAREALNTETKLKAAMYEPEKVAANYIGEKIVEPMVQAPGTTLAAASFPFPGILESGLPAKVGEYEARFHNRIRETVADKIDKKELLEKLIKRRNEAKENVKRNIKPTLSAIKDYITFL